MGLSEGLAKLQELCVDHQKEFETRINTLVKNVMVDIDNIKTSTFILSSISLLCVLVLLVDIIFHYWFASAVNQLI